MEWVDFGLKGPDISPCKIIKNNFMPRQTDCVLITTSTQSEATASAPDAVPLSKSDLTRFLGFSTSEDILSLG